MKSNRLKNGSSSIQRKRSWVGFLFVLPFLTGFVIFFFIPFVWSIAYSFTGGVGGMRFCRPVTLPVAVCKPGISDSSSQYSQVSFDRGAAGHIFRTGCCIGIVWRI